MKKLISALVLSLAAFTTVVVAQPTVKEIYQTAQTDKQQALNMINEVIRSRPNSARAYYIQSELLLQMGKKSEAKASFLKSQQLDPALSFAKPTSVARLENALGIKKPLAWQTDTNRYILYGCGILLVIIIAVMLLRRKKQNIPNYMESYNLQNRPITPYQSSQNVASPGTAAAGVSAPSAPPVTPAAGGSNLMGSLAQGAVMGAGVAAGATLVNHLLNGNKAAATPTQTPVDNSSASSGYVSDSDFGMGDSGGDWGGSVDDSGEW